MPERHTARTVEFTNPFALRGLDGLQPPGIYLIETTEEQLEGLSFAAYRRVSTTISVPTPNAAGRSRQLTEIDPADLDAALASEAEAGHGKS